MILVISGLIKRKKKKVDDRKCWKNNKILNRSAMYLEKKKDDCLKPAPTELDNVIFLTVIVHPDRKHMKKENFCSMAS